jgi:hypothetical protein
MDIYRKVLAATLRHPVSERPNELEVNGWAAEFVQVSMAELAAHSVLASTGNYGDSVRAVTAMGLVLWESDPGGSDETRFWGEGRHNDIEEMSLLADMIVALTKCFVLSISTI